MFREGEAPWEGERWPEGEDRSWWGGGQQENALCVGTHLFRLGQWAIFMLAWSTRMGTWAWRHLVLCQGIAGETKAQNGLPAVAGPFNFREFVV